VTTTDPQGAPDDALTARQARREPLLVLLSRMQRGVLRDTERPLLRAAVETELADGDEAHAFVAKLDAVLVRVRRQLAASDVGADALLTRAEQAEATIERVRNECAAIEQERYGQHDEDADGMREAVRRILNALDRTGNAEPEHTGEAHEARRQQVAAALGLVPGAGWDAILDCAGKTREAAKERAAALQDARDVLARAGYPTDSNGWLVLAPTIRKVTDEVKLLRGNSEVDRREASNRREALATTLKRGPGADWHAVHAAAAEFVRRAEQAEAALNCVWDLADRWEHGPAADAPYARALRAALDGKKPAEPKPQPPNPQPAPADTPVCVSEYKDVLLGETWRCQLQAHAVSVDHLNADFPGVLRWTDEAATSVVKPLAEPARDER
jgi:hypothetical protein